jgi:hypothetical protein
MPAMTMGIVDVARRAGVLPGDRGVFHLFHFGTPVEHPRVAIDPARGKDQAGQSVGRCGVELGTAFRKWNSKVEHPGKVEHP